MSYAVIKTQGKQYKVSPGQVITVDRMQGEKGDELNFEEVLLHVDDGKIVVGTPFLKNVSVTAKIVDHARGVKVRVAKFKAKARYRKATGFRAELTKVQVEDIKFSK